MDDRFLERTDWRLTSLTNPAQRLRQALAQNEFQLYCQPILALRSSEGYPMAEILIRMREEERAHLPPGDFLPVFEHYKLLPELDRWVVSRVIEHLARGSQAPRFTVNVSAQTLQEPKFAAHVGDELRKAEIAPSSLLFEIDETDLHDRLELAARFAHEMKTAGCGVLIDGFGHREIKFELLKALPLDYVKIDGSIVRSILTSEAARTKLHAMTLVAEALNIGLIAECVEEQPILAELKALNVSHAQGFGVHQPHPLDTAGTPPPSA